MKKEIKKYILNEFGERVVAFKEDTPHRGIVATNVGRYYYKKGINTSPILNDFPNREGVFYTKYSQNINLCIPKLVGIVPDVANLFEFVEMENQLVETNIVELLKKIHASRITGSIDNEFSDDARICLFLENQLLSLRKHDSVNNFIEHLQRLLSVIPKLLTLINSLPKVMTHGDFWRGNIICSQGNSYVIDWENFQYTTVYYDLATLYFTDRFIFGKKYEVNTLLNNYGLCTRKNEKCTIIEIVFLFLTIFQIVPAINQCLEKSIDFGWKTGWIEHFFYIVPNYL